MRLKENTKAPNFNLPNQNGRIEKLSDYKGKWVLVYFYPKDFTPGCTKEACSFRDIFPLLKNRLKILGISPNSIESHKKFSERYRLPFSLLSDYKKEVIKVYGADGVIFTKRCSFLINPKGKIQKIFNHVNPATHANEILNYLSKHGF